MLKFLLIASPHMKFYLSSFRLLLFSGFLLCICSYWTFYWSWLGPFLTRASEGMRLRLLVPSQYMQSRIQDYQDTASTSTTSFEPGTSPVPYDNWHTLFDFFYAPTNDSKPPPWPSFPDRLFPILCFCFLVRMWFYNLILRCRNFCWDVWQQCTHLKQQISVLPSPEP